MTDQTDQTPLEQPLLRPRPRRRRSRHRDVRRRLLVAATLTASLVAVGGIATVWTAAARQSTTDASPAAVVAPIPTDELAGPRTTTTPTQTADVAASTSAGRLQDPVAAAAPADRSGVTVERVQIPAIDVDAAVERIGRDDSGILQPPTEWADAGWYDAGVLPGAVGPAVIAGHLDTTERAAVFARLKELTVGDSVVVTLSDGTQATFAVESALDTSKAEFPNDRVYGPTPDAQLRLITCNGPYDDAAQSYANNFVVFASLVPPGE